MLSALELVNAYCGEAGGMHLVRMWETRFDPSPNYEERKANYGGREPLAWAALFRKPGAEDR